MTMRKIKKMKRTMFLAMALMLLTCTVTVPVKASLYATKKSAKVLSDGYGGYFAQVYATNTVYNKANASEAWFKSRLTRTYQGEVISKVTSAKKFFKGYKTTYANSPSAVWPYRECTAKMI